MKELARWQIISFISRMSAQLVGIVQSALIFRILTLSEWGLVQLGLSIGGALGIYQHLGLVSASTREISSAKDDDEIFKIFVTSTAVRYFVTFPMAIGLFVLSRFIALEIYSRPELLVPIRIYAFALLFQGVQGILNSVISGTKRFKQLFIYQVAIAFVSIALYIPLIYFFKINGYFYAFLAFNVVSSIILALVAFKPLRANLVMPSKEDFIRLFKDIFSISIAIYVVKILYTNWENLGNVLLGIANADEVIAIYAAALLFAKKLMSVSDSVTDVNLPVFSEKFVKNIKEFKKLFSENFNKVFVFIVISAVSAAYWAPQLLRILTGKEEYFQALGLIPPLVLAYILYSVINIIKSSVFIPAKLAKQMIMGFVFLLVVTALTFLGMQKLISPLMAMSWGMAAGGVVAFLYMVFVITEEVKLSFFGVDHWLFMFQGFAVSYAYNIGDFWLKILVYVVFLFLMVWVAFLAEFVDKRDLEYIGSKLRFRKS
jgi:stage V sporulation protein B